MANQSDTQRLIQQLFGTHSAGQANVPSAVNNGNPNTVYNVTPSQGGYLPPVSNGYDHWRINPAPAGPAPINWQQMSATGGGGMWGGGMPFPHPPTPVPTTPPPPGWGFPPPGGTTPPPVGNPNPNPPPTTGGPLPPQQGPGGPNMHPGGPGGGEGNRTGAGRGLDWIDLPPGDIGFYDDRQPGTDLSGTIDSLHGWGDMASGEVQQLLGQSLNFGQAGQSLANSALGRSLGIRADGTLPLGEIMDWFLPGNVYMSQTGKLNLLNMLPALLGKVNPVLGLAAKAAMTYLAKHTHIRVLKNWLARNQANAAAGHGGGGSGTAMGGGNMMNGGWMGTGGFGHNYSNGGVWVDSNGNRVDPGTFGSYYTDPTDPNSAYSGGTFSDSGSHPSNGGGGGGMGGAGMGYGGSSNGSGGSSGGSGRGTGGDMAGRNKQYQSTATPKKPTNSTANKPKET